MKDGRYWVMAFKTKYVTAKILDIVSTQEDVASDPYAAFEATLKGDTLTVGGFDYKFSEFFRPEGINLGYFARTRFIPTNDIAIFVSLDMGSNTGF